QLLFRSGIRVPNPLPCLALTLAAFTSLAAADPGAKKAEEIALAQPRVQRLYAQLQQEARAIRDPTLRNDTLAHLARPSLRIIAARRAALPEITAELRAAGLLTPQYQGPLFPAREPMSFVAAPAGAATGHHAYPGGLVYHTSVNLRSAIALAKTYQD